MKNKNQFLSALLYVALSIGVFTTASSCNEDKPADSKEVAKEQNDEKIEGRKNEKDADFVVEAATINREEISLGQLAQQKGKSSSVKKLGKMMEDEHTKSLGDLTALAQTKAITLPATQTDAEKNAYTKLNEKTDKDFDKAYADMMVDGHKAAISKFEKASENAVDPDIKAWATATLPVLRTHLEHAEMCKKETDK